MKVNCNFLPVEYRAFILEKKALTIWIALAVLSTALIVLWARSYGREHAAVAKSISGVQQRQGLIRQEREQMLYPQDRIQKLIDQFGFIQKAMGAKDFPWLRFYQSLEDAIPINESGRRGAYLTRLAPTGEKSWTMEGVVEDWKDASSFESRLTQSTYAPAGNKKNFADVRLVNYRSVDGGKGYSFRIDYTFVDSF